MIDYSLFENLLNFSDDWLIFCNNEGKIQFVSKAIKKITGYSKEEFKGDIQSLEKIIFKDDKEKFLNFLKKPLKRKKSIKLKIVEKNGKVKPVKIQITAISGKRKDDIWKVLKIVDISKEEKLREKKKEAEELINNIFNRFPEPVYSIDKNYTILSVNKNLISKTGKKKSELIGKKCYEVFQKRNSPCELCTVKEVLKTKRYKTSEEEFSWTPGEIKFYKSLRFPVLKNGEVSQIIVVAFDISEEKEIEKAYEKKSIEHELILNSIPDEIFYIDKDGNILGYKEGGKRIFKSRKKRFIGHSIKEFIPSPYNKSALEKIKEALKEKKISTLEFPLTLGKELKFFEARVVPTGEDNLIVIVRDITLQKELQNEISESRALYGEILENIPSGIIRANKKGDVVYINSKTAEIFSLSSKEDYEKINLFTHKNFVKSGISKTIKTSLKKREAQFFKGAYKRDDGKKLFLNIRVLPIKKKNSIDGFLLLIEDLSVEKILQAKVEKEEKKFKAIFDGIRDGIFLVNFDQKIVDFNRAFEKITGFKREVILKKTVGEISYELLPKNIKKKYKKKSYLKEFDEKFKNLIEKIKKDGIVKYETEIENKNGENLILEEYFYKIKIGDKETIVNIKRDITHEVETSKSLKSLKERYYNATNLFKLIADNSIDFIWAKDVKGKYIFANKAFTRMLLGVDSPEILIGKDDSHFGKENLKPKENEYYYYLEEMKRYENEVLKTKKPQRFTVSGYTKTDFFSIDVSLSPIFDEEGKIIGVVGSGKDITKEKLLQKQKEAIEEEHRNLALVIEQSTEAVVITDVLGNIVYVNPAFERITGYKKEELLGKKPNILKSGAHSKEFYKNLWDTILSGRTWSGILQNKRKDGSIFFENAIIFPLFDQSGKIQYFAGVKRDITAERILQSQLAQSQKMEALGTLTSGIAHDFNNFLTVINGYTDLLLKKTSKNDPNYKIFKELRKVGEKSANLVRQLLAFARKQIINPEIIDLNAVITGLKKMLKRLISEDIEISFKLSSEINPIKADPGQIEQIIFNLVVNARDAINESKKKDKKIVISTQSAFLDEDFIRLYGGEKAGQYVILSVSDTGKGIKKENINKIFDPFFTTKPKGKGTGLGLSTVYGIVKQNGGFIKVYSEEGKGTTFKIYLPCTEKEAEASKEKRKIEVKGGSETILVVEDNEDVLNFVIKGLSDYGYNVIGFDKPAKALSFIRKKDITPNLLLTDTIMPGMGGRELSEKIKEIIPEIKIIFTSGYTDDFIIKQKILKKDVFFLPKPYTITELAKIIRDVLDEKPI